MTRILLSLVASLPLLGALACSAAPDPVDAPTESVGAVESQLPKRPPQAGGACHVSFGPYTLIIAGTYDDNGQCCGKTLCTDGCAPGEKYIDVCIDCSADPDVQCGDGHHPVALTHLQLSALESSALMSIQP
jgi:hypothetical protein